MDINELTYQINGAVFEKSLVSELRKLGVRAEPQVPIEVKYKRQPVGEYFADIYVENRVVLELKAVRPL